MAVNVPVSQGIILAESKPLTSAGRSVGWTAEVVNIGPADPLTITAYAVCAP